MSEEDDQIVNPFPNPPSFYKRYTKFNLDLLTQLRSRTGTATHDPIASERQNELLADHSPLPEFDLTVLERPRADWIVEEGGYETFGDVWPIPERHPTLEEGGLTQLYPKVADHRPALQKLLKTLLTEYYNMLEKVTLPPPNRPDERPEWVRSIDWIRIVALNMVAAVNELRPVQARNTLELALKTQLETRREETKAIHAKCDELSAMLAALQPQAAVGTAIEPADVKVEAVDEWVLVETDTVDEWLAAV